MDLIEIFETRFFEPNMRNLFNQRLGKMERFDGHASSPMGYLGYFHQTTTLKCICGGRIAIARFPLGSYSLYAIYCEDCLECFVDGAKKDKIYRYLGQNFVP